MTDTKTHPITIRVSTKMLRQIDRRCEAIRLDLGSISREQFILDALEAYLALPTASPLELEERKRSKVTKAIAHSTEQFKTGRFEP